MNACARAYDAHDPALRIKVRYEDLLAETARQLGELARWLGLPAGAKRVREDRHPKRLRGRQTRSRLGPGSPVRQTRSMARGTDPGGAAGRARDDGPEPHGTWVRDLSRPLRRGCHPQRLGWPSWAKRLRSRPSVRCGGGPRSQRAGLTRGGGQRAGLTRGRGAGSLSRAPDRGAHPHDLPGCRQDRASRADLRKKMIEAFETSPTSVGALLLDRRARPTSRGARLAAVRPDHGRARRG